MEEVVKFLKACGAYFLATADGDQPRVRPFGTANIFEGKLYIQTGKSKDCSKQIQKNGKVEICAMNAAASAANSICSAVIAPSHIHASLSVVSNAITIPAVAVSNI